MSAQLAAGETVRVVLEHDVIPLPIYSAWCTRAEASEIVRQAAALLPTWRVAVEDRPERPAGAVTPGISDDETHVRDVR